MEGGAIFGQRLTSTASATRTATTLNDHERELHRDTSLDCGLAVDTNRGWKGPEKCVAIVPQVFDLWQEPQERYDILMNNYTEGTGCW